MLDDTGEVDEPADIVGSSKPHRTESTVNNRKLEKPNIFSDPAAADAGQFQSSLAQFLNLFKI